MMIISWRRAAVTAILAAANAGLQATAQTTVAEGWATAPASRNVYSAGGTVRPAGPIEGDFVAFGGRVTLDQAVKGDALLGGGSIEVRAPVGDDLRVAGGDVNIDSTVGGELFAAGGNVVLTKSAQVQQGASLGGGLVTIDGRIVGKLKASAQRIVLNGEVTGDARLIAETIELGPTAKIGGALSHTSREFKRAEGAVVIGPLTREESADTPRERGPDRHRERHWELTGPSWVGTVLGYLGLVAAGAVLVLLFPKFSAEAPEVIRGSPGLSLATGFGMLVGVPVLAVLLFVTLLGIPLGIAAFALYPLLLLMGYLTGVLFLAQRSRQALRAGSPATFGSTIGFLALALLVLMLIGHLPVVGPLTVLVTLVLGLGACVIEWYRRRQAPPAAPT